MVVYQYVCHCDCRYVGQTSQRLQDRINQHIPRCIRSDKRPTKNLPNRKCKITSTPSVYCDSAIGQHLLENEECAKHYNDAQFSYLATARSSFHLSVLEATYINSLQPSLCRQKEFVYSLQISDCNCNYILFTKLPWPGDSEGTFRSSSQAATCPPVYHTRRKLHTVPLIAERQAGML